MTSSTRDTTVYLWLPGRGYTPAALLTEKDNGTAYSLGYGKQYVKRSDALPLDPVSLPLSLSVPVTRVREGLFSVLRDAAPDKWGRKVLGIMAGQYASTLTEMDILTAVHASQRIGALAFGKNAADGPCSMAPWADEAAGLAPASDIEAVARVIAQVDALRDDDDLEALRRQLPEEAFMQALASSLSVGGGRPKTLVQAYGGPCIAKFSKRGDPWNEPRVEHATMTLAALCGIDVAQTRVHETESGSVLLVRRFDRTSVGEPRHIISGFTLNPQIAEDGDWGSYQDMALKARQYGDANAGPELFRRMVFNALCSNVDDHPRNHAWFVTRQGIAITPVYDVVPTQLRFKENLLALACGRYGRQATIANVLSNTGPFGLQKEEAEVIIGEMLAIMAGWREHFAACNVAEKDIQELEYRFAQVGQGLPAI